MSKPSYNAVLAFSPIEYRREDPEQREADIRSALAAMQGQESIFAQCDMAHMVRLQVIDQIKPAMGGAVQHPLKTKYLLFCADIDGELPDFLDALYGSQPDVVHKLWGRCLGYPQYEGAVFFRRYIERCLVGKPLSFCAFPGSTVQDIKRLISLQKEISGFAARVQGAPVNVLRQAWRDLQPQIAPSSAVQRVLPKSAKR